MGNPHSIRKGSEAVEKNAVSALVSSDLRNKSLLLIILPVLIYYIVFEYFPMYGVIIAFQNFSPRRGIWGVPG